MESHFRLVLQRVPKEGQGHDRMVPKLRESYVLRDAWTKLNALPAKIMQVLEKFFVHGSTNYQLSARTGNVRIASVHSLPRSLNQNMSTVLS